MLMLLKIYLASATPVQAGQFPQYYRFLLLLMVHNVAQVLCALCWVACAENSVSMKMQS